MITLSNCLPLNLKQDDYPMFNLEYEVDETQLATIAKNLANVTQHSSIIFLQGDLGAGKTTFSRYFIQALGYQGAIKSPTYTIVEPYQLPTGMLYHFDLYRLIDPEELEFMGIRDYFTENTICLIEWSEKGQGVLPQPDIQLTLNHLTNERRKLLISFNTERAETWYNTLNNTK